MRESQSPINEQGHKIGSVSKLSSIHMQIPNHTTSTFNVPSLNQVCSKTVSLISPFGKKRPREKNINFLTRGKFSQQWRVSLPVEFSFTNLVMNSRESTPKDSLFFQCGLFSVVYIEDSSVLCAFLSQAFSV